MIPRMLSTWKFCAMRCASGLGLVLLLTAHGQVWPWLVSEKNDDRRCARPVAPAGSDDEKSESSRRRPLAVLATLPDPSPLRNVASAYSSITERSASADRGYHAAGSRDGATPGAEFDVIAPFPGPDWLGTPAPIVVASALTMTPVRAHALETAIRPQAPPA